MSFPLTRKTKLIAILAISAFALLLVGVSRYVFWEDLPFNWIKYTTASPKIAITYPKAFQVTNLDKGEAESRNRETLFRAVEGERLSETPFVVALSKEVSLRIAASLSRADIVPMLLRNIERAYPQRFPEYLKTSEKTFDYKGKKAAEIYFTYTSPANELIRQRMMIVGYDGDTALYFTAQARESDFSRLNKKYFDKMFSELDFQ